MKKLIFLLALALVFCQYGKSECSEVKQHQSVKETNIFKNLDQYHFCHRCGMAIEKSDKVITVTRDIGKPWYQCCPMCALMDIIESGDGNGKITAYCDKSGKKIQIDIAGKQINKMMPESTVLLVGGSCPKNKIFHNKEYALGFIEQNSWAKKEMLKPVAKVFAMLKNKKTAIERCKMCTTELKGHEKTWFTIMAKGKKRMVACCGHCGLFMMYKLKDKAVRAVTPDFKTGRLIDAKQAFYVAGNDLVVCCIPSTITFEKKQDAVDFKKLHSGEILTFDYAMKNIDKIMNK